MITRTIRAQDIYSFPFGDTRYLVSVDTDNSAPIPVRNYYISKPGDSVILFCTGVDLDEADISGETELISANMLDWIMLYESVLHTLEEHYRKGLTDHD